MKEMKKAQFQNMETIIITIVLTILFVSGYAIYNNISYGNWENQQLEFEKSRRAQVNTMIANLPEFKCSTLGVEEVSCIDVYKIDAFINSDIDKQIYEEIFGDVEIVLKIVNLEDGSSHEKPIFNNSIDVYTSKTPVFTPVLINNPVSKHSNFGMLITTFYER